MMAAPSEVEVYFDSVPQEKRHKLDNKLDFDHGGVQTDLGIIACSMAEWEGKVAECLQLTPAEIAAIKTEYPGKLPLQTRAALQKWQEKIGPMATYRNLIVVFVRAGKGDCAEAVCKVLRESDSQLKGTPPRHEVPHTPILRYTMYLKGVYRSTLTSTDKIPHLPCNKYTNLALVKKERISRSQADSFTKATLHGHIDEILKKKEPVTMEQILNPTEGQPDMKCVFMEGAPGIGKSTCVWELCRRWDEIDALRKYSLVILLRLREKRVQEAQNIADLCYHENAELRQAVAAEIEACEGRGVLFVLDGFDELPASLRKQSLFVKLIQGTYLSHCTVLVTSRPSATADLLSVAQPQIHKQIEVVGFTHENIEQYARVVFTSQTDILDDFLKYIATHPPIRSMMYVPLNSTMVVEIYQHSRTANRPIPQTMTQLYIEMSLTLLHRYLDGKDDAIAEDLPEDLELENLPPKLKEPFALLTKLAFEGLVRGEVIFSKLPAGCNHFGFMNSLTELYMGRKASLSHSFLHLTLQEFLSALYITQLSPSDQKSVFEEHCKTAGWDVVWRFVAGLSGFQGIGWDLVQSRRGRSIDGRVRPFLVSCLYEAQEDVIYDSVLGGSEVSFLGGYGSMTAFDSYALGYCVSKSGSMWRLDMSRNFSLGDTLVEMFQYGLCSPCKSPPLMEHASILSLDLHSCCLPATGFNHLAKVIPLMSNLRDLNIRDNRPGDGGLVNLLHSLSHLKSLRSLNMIETNIGCTDIEALSHLIDESSGYLKELMICDMRMSPEYVELTLKTVLSPSSLESVELREVTRNARCTNQAALLLECNYNLAKLSLHGWCTTVSPLIKALHKNSGVRELHVDDCSPESTSVSLSEMLKVNHTLETLEWKPSVSPGYITLEWHEQDVLLELKPAHVRALNNALKFNHRLKQFIIKPEYSSFSFEYLTNIDPRLTIQQRHH